MDINEYQRRTEETAIYPDEFPDFVTPELIYVCFGHAGETGEVMEKIKKAIRENDPEYLEDMKDELGDNIWYWTRIAEELGEDAGEILESNLEKLEDRRERGKLTGEGDDR